MIGDWEFRVTYIEVFLSKMKVKKEMGTRPKIEKVLMRYGFLQSEDGSRKNSSSGLSDIEFSGKEIPEKVASQIYEDDLFSLKLSYGDPSLGNPIEFNFLRVTADGKDHEVEIQIPPLSSGESFLKVMV